MYRTGSYGQLIALEHLLINVRIEVVEVEVDIDGALLKVSDSSLNSVGLLTHSITSAI